MKRFLLAFTLLATPALADQKLTLTMDQAEAQLLINKLSEGQWKDVNPLMTKLIGQINEQMKPPPKAKPNE
jgi:hypothetical protein